MFKINKHHHQLCVMELGHLLTRSGLTYPEDSSKVCHDSFCQLGNNVSLPWVTYYEAFYLQNTESQRYDCITSNGGNAISKYARPVAKGSKPTTGLNLL
jgi:hypothetical protein